MKKFLSIAYKIFFWFFLVLNFLFVFLFVLAGIYSCSDEAKAEYYPPHDYGFSILNADYYDANLLNVSGQNLNYSEWGFYYPDDASISIGESIKRGIVRVNADAYHYNVNSMMLIGRNNQFSERLYVSAFVKCPFYSSINLYYALFDENGNAIERSFIPVTNQQTDFTIYFPQLDYTGKLYFSFYVDSSQFGDDWNFNKYVEFEQLMFSFGNDWFIPSFSDVQYFSERIAYNTGYNNGYSIGLQDGLDLPEPTAGNFFQSVLSILDVKIFGFVSLGDIFKVVVSVALVLLVLKLFAGG